MPLKPSYILPSQRKFHPGKFSNFSTKMEEYPRPQKPTKAWKILRTSTHTFLTHFHHFTSTPTLLALPFSLCLLLHLSTSPSTAAAFHSRLHAILLAAGFPLTSPTSQLLLLKLSQTLSSSLSSLPFSFSFLLLSKSATIQSVKYLQRRRPPPSNDPFFPLLLTHICNLFVLVAANSACFSLLCLAFTAGAAAPIDSLPIWISTAGAVIYSVVIANAIVVCNLALISSGWEGKGGFSSILRACLLIRGKTATALVLALPANLAMAAAEVLFRYRIYGVGGERPMWTVSAEAVLIAFLYSVLIVWDTIVGCLFYQRCKEEVGDCDSEVEEYPSDPEKLRDLEQGF